MTKTIDYEKYSNMSVRQLTNALINAEKNQVKTNEKLQQAKELVKFLKNKIKESVSEPKYYTLETSPSNKEFKKMFENLTEAQKEKFIQEYNEAKQKGIEDENILFKAKPNLDFLEATQKIRRI